MDNQTKLFQAMQFANWAHRNQKRKLSDQPYVVHPYHVLFLLLSHGVNRYDKEGLDALIAGVLHDAQEDNPEEVSFDHIENLFGKGVAEIVRGVTLDPNNPDKRRSRQKILEANWMTQIVKAADIMSNTMSVIDSIKHHGVEETQKHFRQPLPDRVIMEREFLEAIPDPRRCAALFEVRKSALNRLDELDALLKT